MYTAQQLRPKLCIPLRIRINIHGTIVLPSQRPPTIQRYVQRLPLYFEHRLKWLTLVPIISSLAVPRVLL